MPEDDEWGEDDGPGNDEWLDRLYAGPHYEGGKFVPAEPRRSRRGDGEAAQ